MRAIAIVNPISGRRDVARRVERVRDELARRGCELDVVPTRGAGDGRRIAAEAPDDLRAVIAVGGDGTAHDVAAGLLGRDPPLAVLPAGTENIVAREFRVHRRPDRFAEMIVRGATTLHDVGVLWHGLSADSFTGRMPVPRDVATLGGEPFIIMCGIGFDARVVERLSAGRRGHIGYVSYVSPLWRTFWESPFPELQVSADGERVFEGRGLAFVGVQPRYSIGLRILARSVHDDGRMDLCIYPCTSRVGLLRHAARTFLRRHTTRGGVIYRKCDRVEIRSPQRVPVQCDGDPAPPLPASLQVLPQALRLIVPWRIQNSEFRIQKNAS